MPNDEDLVEDIKALTKQLIQATQYCLDPDFANSKTLDSLELIKTDSTG